MRYWALLVDSFRESRDRKIFWFMLAFSILTAAGMFCVGIEPGRVSILFGLWEIDTQWLTSAGGLRHDLIATVLVDIIMDTLLGGVGIVLVIVATAGFFPSWMDRGSIDIVVSKSLPRWKLFLGRYVGSMAFITFHATVFVVLTFLVVGFRWGTWIPGYLWSIPLIVLLFSYLYCVSVLAAVLFRSAITSVLLTLFAWMSFAGVQTVDDAFTTIPKWQEYRTVHQSVRVARWIVPKTQDIIYLAKRAAGAAGAAELMPEPDEEDREFVDATQKAEDARMAINPVHTIGSSLLFEALLLMMAIWKFSRTDF